MESPRTNWIVSPRVDVPFFILAALSGYALLSAHLVLGVSTFLLWWFWHVSMNGAHFFATLSRTYLDPEEWRQRPVLLVASLGLIGCGPLAIWLGLQLGSPLPFFVFWLVQITWAYWHVARQHYGFVALYQRANGEKVSGDNREDWWIFNVLMFAPALVWFSRHPELRTSLGMGGEGGFVDDVLVTGLLVGTGVALIAWMRQVARGLAGGTLNVPKTLLLAAYVPLHLLMFLYRPVADLYDPYLLNTVITYPHNIQYMAIVWFHNRRRYQGPGSAQRYGLAAVVSRSLPMFLGASLVYGLVYYYSGYYLEGVAVPGALGAFSMADMPLAHEGGPRVADLIASIWIGFAFHHYYLDQKIWKVRQDVRLQKDLGLSAR